MGISSFRRTRPANLLSDSSKRRKATRYKDAPFPSPPVPGPRMARPRRPGHGRRYDHCRTGGRRQQGSRPPLRHRRAGTQAAVRRRGERFCCRNGAVSGGRRAGSFARPGPLRTRRRYCGCRWKKRAGRIASGRSGLGLDPLLPLVRRMGSLAGRCPPRGPRAMGGTCSRSPVGVAKKKKLDCKEALPARKEALAPGRRNPGMA